jgi:hypothetical protein
MSEDKQQTFEIEEPEVETQVEITEENTSKQEFELAKKHGMVKEEKVDEHKVEPVVRTDDTKVKEEEVESPTFEQVEAKEELVEKFNKNEKALYWKWKTDKQKRQSLQKEKEDLQADYELDKVKHGVYKARQDKLSELINSGAELTVEQIKQVLEEGKIEDKPREKKPEIDVLKEKIQTKASFAEKIGQSRYENFQEISNLAKEIITEDKTGVYQQLIDNAFTSDKVDETTLVEQIVNIARLSPKFASLGKSGTPEEKREAAKVIANTSKKVSSASITGGGGKRVVSEDELTPDDVARFSSDQWRKLSKETKERLLKG